MADSEFIEIPFSRGPSSRKDGQNKVLQNYFDVNLQISPHEKAFELDSIVFQNFYTFSLSILQQNSSHIFQPILENFILMDNAYTLEKSQNWFLVNTKDLNSNYSKGRPLRFVLVQPGPLWVKYDIKNLKFLSKSASRMKATSAYAPGNAMHTENLLDMLHADFKLLGELAALQISIDGSDDAQISSSGKKIAKKKDKKKKSEVIPNTAHTTNTNFANVT